MTKKNELKIRAIDPGPEMSAFVDWNGKEILGFGKVQNDWFVSSEPDFDGIDLMVIEMVASYGMAVGKDVFETVFWTGRIYEACLSADIRCERLYRRDVKMYLCGNAQAKDTNIMTAIIDRFDPLRKFGKYGKGTKSNPGPFFGFAKDVWAAFGVALTAFNREVEK